MKLEYILVITAVVVVALLFGFGKTQVPLENITEKDIHDALKDGNKLLAIKYYRVIKNCNLTEAKQAIEDMARKL